MVARQRTDRTTRRRGFTLVEILLVIGLLVLLAGMTVPLFKSDTPYQKIERTADRLSSLLAMCRAEAMLHGHPFRVTWPKPTEENPTDIQPLIVHEADPVGSPGQYSQVAASWAREPVIEPGVKLRLIQPGVFDIATLSSTKGRFTVPADPSLVDAQLHPDGTADPAVFVLTIPPGGDSQEDLQFWVVLDGITGLCKVREPPTAKQFDAMLALQDALPDMQFQEKSVEVVTQTQPGEQTLASLLNGGTGGASTLSSSDLQQVMGALQPLLNSLKSGTGSGALNQGTSNPGGRNPASGGNPGGRNPGGSANSGGNSGGNPGNNPGGRNPGGNAGGNRGGSGNPGGNPGNNPGGRNPGGRNPGGNPGGSANSGGNPGNNPGGRNPGGNPGNNPGGRNPGGRNPGSNTGGTGRSGGGGG